MFWIVLLMAQAAVPSQTERGEALFFDAQQGCGSCHALKGKGTAVGPDLTGLGRLGPQAIAMAARSTVTQYVQGIKLKSGGAGFPAMTGKKDDKGVVLFDLSKNPPEKKVVAPDDIASSNSNDMWKPTAAASKIEPEKLADIVAYIKYASTGSKKAVDPADVR